MSDTTTTDTATRTSPLNRTRLTIELAERPHHEMTDPVIREATTNDTDRLAAVYRSAYAESRELGFPMKAESATEQTVREWIETYSLIAAEVEGTLVGAVRLDTSDDECATLSRLGVHEDWKGEGVGSALLEHAERYSRNHDIDRIELTTPETHPYLPEYYRSRGYEYTADKPLEYREYDEIVMTKDLTPTAED